MCRRIECKSFVIETTRSKNWQQSRMPFHSLKSKLQFLLTLYSTYHFGIVRFPWIYRSEKLNVRLKRRRNRKRTRRESCETFIVYPRVMAKQSIEFLFLWMYQLVHELKGLHDIFMDDKKTFASPIFKNKNWKQFPMVRKLHLKWRLSQKSARWRWSWIVSATCS